MLARQYIGARYVPAFYENQNGTPEWESGVIYEPLTIVIYNGNSYTSKKNVPASVGDPSNNPDYWAATGNYNAQIQDLTNKIAAIPFKYPEDFGAVGDGVTDDTAAFRDMFLSGSQYFMLKDKTYKLTSAVDVPYTCYIGGQGLGTLYQTTKRANILNLQADNITVQGVIFKSTGEGFEGEGTEGSGTMILAEGSNTNLIGCQFKDANYVGVYIFKTADNSNLIGCLFDNCWAEGLSYQAKCGAIIACDFYDCKYNGVVLRGAENTEVDNCHFVDCAVTDVAIDFHKHHDTVEYTKNCVISNCTIENAYIAISMVGLDFTSEYFENIILRNNIIRNGRAGGNMAVRCYYTKDLILEGNIIEDAGDTYSVLLSSCQDVTVKGNVMKRSAAGTEALYTSTRGLKVLDNTFKNYNVGVHINSGSAPFDWNYMIADNVFKGCVKGLQHQGNYAKTITIDSNVFLDGTDDMDLAGGSGTVVVAGNVLHGNYTHTIATQAYIQNGNSPLDRPDRNSTSLGAGDYRGQMFFATDLGVPIFYNGSAWVKADGTTI